MYEIIIILCLATVFFILLCKLPQTNSPAQDNEKVTDKLSDINYYKEAESFFKDKKYKEAEKYYIKAIAEDTDNPKIYGRLGVVYFNQENFKDAREAFRMAIKLAPSNAFYHNNMGMVLYSVGKYKEAILYFENALKIDDSIGKRWLNLGLCYEKIGETKKAKECFLKSGLKKEDI